MSLDTKQLLMNVLKELESLDYVHPDEIPNIELYMDQVTTFMDAQLSSTRRYEEDKILTKTMINNYTKNQLLPPPIKKKYSKDHLLLLVFIYYFKSILCIKDIDQLLKPISERAFATPPSIDLAGIYQTICDMEHDQLADLKQSILASYERAESFFPTSEDAPKKEDADVLTLFSFICNLSFDVYVKKLLLERLIDALPEHDCEKK
jgi:hypothetical protein